MNEMVERVARAICAADGKDPDADWRDVGPVMLMVAVEHPENWHHYVKQAKSAITAMREPTEAMVGASRDMPGTFDGGFFDAPEDCVADIWRAMIDAAMKP